MKEEPSTFDIKKGPSHTVTFRLARYSMCKALVLVESMTYESMT